MTVPVIDTSSTVRPWVGVATITASLFVCVTSELMPIGLLSPVSASLSVTVGLTAMIVTLYGISAGIGVPFIVAWTRRVDRRVLLATLLAVLAAGNLVTALAPTFAIVLVARLVMGFAHGVFWAIGMSMAARLVPEQQVSKAIAAVLSGMSIATVVGLPLGAAIETATSWRMTFAIWSALSLLVCLAVIAALPQLPSSDAVAIREVLLLPVRNARLRWVMLTVTLYVLGHFAAYSFIRPLMDQRAEASPGLITALLVVFGIGGVVGNFAAGRAVTRSLYATFVAGCGGLVVSLLLLAVIGDHQVGLALTAVLWGVSFGAANLCQVKMVLAAVPDAFEAAMSLNTLGYNLAIAIGSLLGGLFTDHLGLVSAAWLGVVLTAAALGSAAATRPALAEHRSTS